jgi:nitrite reductase/ring-hydroxylating ferredoxin subunit
VLKKIPQSTRLVLCPDHVTGELPDRIRLSDLTAGTVKTVKTRRGQTAIVFLQGGRPRAFDSRCPHMGADLAQAICAGAESDIVCPWHGYRYSGATGELLENPNETIMKGIRVPSVHFDPSLRTAYKLREYQIEIEDGWIRVG